MNANENNIFELRLVDKSDVVGQTNKRDVIRCCNDPSHTSKIDKFGHPCWYKKKVDKDGKFDKNGRWDNKSYLCSACYSGNGQKRQRNAYVHKGLTVCRLCGTNETAFYQNKALWHAYKVKDNKFDLDGEWDKKNYICRNCYSNENEKRKRLSRNKELPKDTTRGKGFIGEQIWCVTRGVKNCNIEADNFNYPFDHSPDSVYGIVQTKISSLGKLYQYFYWVFAKEPFDVKGELKEKYDNIVLICMDIDWNNVERVYIIPYDVIFKLKTISIPRDGDTWYEQYRVDEKPYNDVYHSMKIENCSVIKNE